MGRLPHDFAVRPPSWTASSSRVTNINVGTAPPVMWRSLELFTPVS